MAATFETPLDALQAVLRRVEHLEKMYKRKVDDPDLSDPSSRWEWRAKADGLWPVKRALEDWIEIQGGSR